MTQPNAQAGGSSYENPPGRQGLSDPGSTPPGGSSTREQIRDVKNQVVDQAKTSLQQARDRATSSLGESKTQFADQIGTVASALRRTTEHLRGEDQARIAGLTDSLARQVDQAANYLRQADGRLIRQDLESLTRRRPALVLGSALALGLLGARFLKSSRPDRGRTGDGTDYSRIGGSTGGYGRGYGYAGEAGSGGYGGAGGYGSGGYGGAGEFGDATRGYSASGQEFPGPRASAGGFDAGA
jgi:hypothetical protein